MRHLLLSSRCLQGRPPGPDTKRLLGRHRYVTHLSDITELRLSKTGQDATVTGDWVRCGIRTTP